MAAASAGVDTGHSGCTAASRAITSGDASAYPMRRPANAQVLVRLRNTITPGRSRAASDDGSGDPDGPSVVSANASSTTRMRPGRARAVRIDRGCSTEVGFVGLPTKTRSADAGTSDGSSVYGGGNSTRETRWPAANRAASGSVNCGCTTTGETASR